MREYAQYTASRETWLPAHPIDWRETPLWTLFTRDHRKGFPGEQLLSVYRDHGVVPRASRDDNHNIASEDLSAYQLVEPGDLVVNKMKAWQGSMSVSELRGIVSPAYFVFRPRRKAVQRYLHYLLRSQPLIGAYIGFSKGVRPGQWDLDPWAFSRLVLPLPSVAEQRAIAEFLDRETAKINELVAEQQRLIDLLRERRSAAVSSALLGGLDLVAQRKPSGDERLGDIPSHWGLVPARHLATITTGGEDSGNANDDGEYPFYVRGREILRIGHFSFNCEAVLTPGDGQGGTGKVFHYVNGPFEAHQRVYVFKDFREITGWYFYYYLSTFLGPVALASSSTVTMESLRRPVLASFRVALPPLSEQRQITAYLDEETAKIDTLMVEAERLIELSRERRSALITAAVTGQFDVRAV